MDLEQKKRELARIVCRDYFRDDYNNPLEITDCQADIFNSIFFKERSRVQIIAPTQYGKSTILACALILRTQIYGEPFTIVAGRKDKADIIMSKVIQHTFDDKRLYSQLDLDKNEPLERLKRERSKDKIVWKCGGEINTLSAQTKSAKNVIYSLTGEGSPNIVEDESSLVPDEFQSMIIRMLGGHQKNFLIKVGNPFLRNHFLKTWHSPRYYKIFIDYKKGLEEGRYTQEFIDEAREGMPEKLFKVLYECGFPDEEEVDLGGYYRLLSDEEIHTAKQEAQHKGDKKLGFDVGEGGGENLGVVRSDSYAEIAHESMIKDLMATTAEIVKIIQFHEIKEGNVFPDATGIGSGVASRLNELGVTCVPVKWGEKAKNEKVFFNLKAENYWDLAEWIRQGGKLNPHQDWSELEVIRWKKDSGGKIRIKPKEELRKEGIKSPNRADALALSFNKSIEDTAPKITIL